MIELSFVGIAILVAVVLVLSGIVLFVKQFQRCPSNRVLVVFGKGLENGTSKCIHGGGVFVWPIIQDYAYLSLEPLTIELDVTGALSKKNIRVNAPSTFTVGVSTRPEIMANAAQRLLGMNETLIQDQARDIILGQLRLVIATLTIEEINQDRDQFKDLVNQNVESELNKIGLTVINVNIRDITDESGYIDAIGRKAAAEAINKAKVEVADQEKVGAIGEAAAYREREVQVAKEKTQAAIGQTEAQQDQRKAVARLDAEGAAAEAASKRQREIAIAQEAALSEQGKKEADMARRVAVAGFEASAVKGEAEAQALIADTQAKLSKQQAEAKQTSEVAMAQAQTKILEAERLQEIAFLEKTELARREVEKRQLEVEADAQAEKTRRIAKGDADAVLMRYQAEAEGLRKVLEAKADGYRNLLQVCGERPELAPTLLLIEKLPELIAEQVKAVQNLKIDKITVWDGGAGGNEQGATAGFLRGLIGSLPAVHDLAKQAGIDLPPYLGKLAAVEEVPSINVSEKA